MFLFGLRRSFILKFSSSLPLISLSNNLVDFSYVYLGDERREYVIVKNAGSTGN